jgi:thiamine transporter ThiT
MANTMVISKSRPSVLKYVDVRSYIITAVFILLDVLVPRLFHQFHLAGATYLPMHIFVLMAGLLYGWRAGLIVGLLTPISSYAVSQMPMASMLPQVTVELAAYGLVAGLLRERCHFKAVWSLLTAMVTGRVALFATISIIYLVAGTANSPLGAAATPWSAIGSAVRQGLPGILIQLALLPIVVWVTEKLSSK